jgi:hypothetical protein
MIINTVDLDYSIVSHWLLRCPTARRVADFGIIEKPTCSDLHECSGVILAYLSTLPGPIRFNTLIIIYCAPVTVFGDNATTTMSAFPT